MIKSLRPVVFAFGKYYELAGLYFLAALIWALAPTYVSSGLVGPWYYEFVAFWMVLLIPALGAGVLWISKQPLLYAIITGLTGTAIAIWTMTTTIAVPAFLGTPAATLAP